MATINLINERQAKNLINNYFLDHGYNTKKITETVVDGFMELVKSDYEQWMKDLLDSEFKYGLMNHEIEYYRE